MYKKNRIFSLVLTMTFMSNFIFAHSISAYADTGNNTTTLPVTQITVDGSKADKNPANTFKGFGMVSANGTSRLLLDYKSENPDKYWKIMNQLFNSKTGMGLNHIKVELGADVNTSTETTPATMRTEDEKANVLRGTDWHIVADAKKVNPNISVDALRWAEPKWVDDAFSTSTDAGYSARYKWYKDTIDAVYDTYGIKIDYIDPDKNETGSPEVAWIKYFSQHLKSETEERYDYSKIKIVASDENGTLKIATAMKNDADLRNAVDVMGMHYNCYGTADSIFINQTYHKEVWYSEATAPMTFAENRLNSSTPAGGLGGVNGALDVANHFINMYYTGDTTSAYMTRYEFQPAVSSFYDGGQYSSKELIGADSPWSGYFYSDSGAQMVRQFMNFVHTGWEYISGACYGDGTGANSITNTTNNYLTLTDPNSGDYSMILTNDSAVARNYSVTVKNLTKAGSTLKVWETKGPDAGQEYDANWMKHIGDITPAQNADGSYTFTYSVKPYSIVTLTTTKGQTEYQRDSEQSKANDTVLPLPYTDDFEYKDAKYTSYKDDSVLNSNAQSYLASRGDTPRYTTDIGGAFEVNEGTDNNTLMAKIDSSTHANGEWNSKPGNDTVLGDDRWSNYQVSIDFLLDTVTAGTGANYAGIAARNLITSGGENPGYILKVFKDGSYQLLKGSTVQKSGTIDNFDNSKWHNESLKVIDNTIAAYVDGSEIAEFTDASSQYMSGKVGITSGYYHTQFDNLKVLPIEGYPCYVNRADDLDSGIIYQGMWKNNATTGFGNFNRTNSVSSMNLAVSHLTKAATEGTLNAFYYYKPSGAAWGSNSDNAWSQEAGSYYEVSFKGSGLIAYGYKNSSNGTGNVYLDGQLVSPNVSFKSSTAERAVIYQVSNLDEGAVHTLKVAVASGFIDAAGVEISSSQYSPGKLIYNFNGTGFNLVGNTAASSINITVDGKAVATNYSVSATSDRSTSYYLHGLENGNHTLQVELVKGSYSIDAIEVLGNVYTPDKIVSADLTIDNSTITKTKTAKLSVSALLNNGNAVDMSKAAIEYLSSSPDIVSVDSNGLATGKAVGSADITAKVTFEGTVVQSNLLRITVTDAAPAPTVTPTPTVEPTPTPTVTPAPTVEPTPTPTVTPAPTVKPTTVPTVTPSPAPVVTSTTTSGQSIANTDADAVVNAIKAAAEGAVVTVDVNSNKQVAKEIFDAIKGTGKTVTFVQDGVEWSFNGKDITEDTKNIDMTINMAKLSKSAAPNKAGIAEKVKNEDVFVISFAENGKLPGKATVKIKLDSEWLSGKDKNNLYVYYYNPNTKKAELAAKQLKADENGYVQFDITHNSDYFISDNDLVQSGIIPQTGSVIDTNLLIGFGILALMAGASIVTIRRKKSTK